MIYTVLYKNNDSGYVSTYISDDGVERVIGEEIAYTATHGPNAAIGSSWKFAVPGEDESDPCIAQFWRESLEGVGYPFRSSDYIHSQEGRVSFIVLF